MNQVTRIALAYMKKKEADAYHRWHKSLSDARERFPKLHKGLGMLEELVRDGEFDGADVESNIEMAAWDAGWQGRRLPPWVKNLGKAYRINVAKIHKDGMKARQENDDY